MAWRSCHSGAPRRGSSHCTIIVSILQGVRSVSAVLQRLVVGDRPGLAPLHRVAYSVGMFDYCIHFRANERSAKTGPRTPRGFDAHCDALESPLLRLWCGCVALVHEHSAQGRRSGGCEGIAAALHLMCATQAPAHAAGWMNASSAPTARAKAATLARVCV